MNVRKQYQQLYFIALVCPEPLQTEITAIKNYFFEKYNCKVALKSPAHITLIPPFDLKHHDEDVLCDHLFKFKTSVRSIFININGFGHFEKRTVFLQPERNDELHQLQLNVQTNLNQKLLHIKTQQHYHPHITVANRDINPGDFDEAWNFFKDKDFKSSFECDQLALLKLTDKKWSMVSGFDWRE